MRGYPQGIVAVLCGLALSQCVIAEELKMTPADWRTVKEGLLEDNGKGYYIDILQQDSFGFFGLRYGDESNQLTGYSMGNSWSIDDMPEGEIIPTQCWNEQTKKWIDQDDRMDRDIRIEHNKIHTHYTGTNVPIVLTVTPFDTQSAAWQQQLQQYPQGLKFQQVKWPAHVYKVKTVQTRDVMCRDTDTIKYPIRGDRSGIEKLDNSIIVNSLFREFYPDGYHGSRGEFTLNDGRHFTWRLQSTTLGEQLLALQQDFEMETGGFEEPVYYQWQPDGWLQQVQLNTRTDDKRPTAERLVLPSEFARKLATHLKSVGTPMPSFDDFESLIDVQEDE